MAGKWKWGFALIAGIWAAFLGIGIGKGWNYAQSQAAEQTEEIWTAEEESSGKEEERKKKGSWTIAVFGVDSRDGRLDRGTRSDMEMVCSVNLDTGRIRLVSIYRDTYARIGENNQYDKINQAYFLGGPKRAVQVLEENLDLEIDDYIAFDWKTVAEAINILGGVDVDISQEEFQVINGFITETVESTGIGSVHLAEPGFNHLDGVQAVAYGRLRKMDTDFARTKRQRLVAQLIFEKAKKADYKTLAAAAAKVLSQVSTSLGVQDGLNLVAGAEDFFLDQMEGFPFILEDKIVGKKDCVIPVTLEENVIRLHQFLYDKEDYQPSDEVKEISREIMLRTRTGSE